MQTSPSRYDQTSIVLHWTIALGIIAIAAAEILRGELFAKGSLPREVLKALHEPAGTLILALIVLRLVWRATHAAPALPLGMHDWERSGAKLTHWILYAFPVVICLSGMATTFARGRSIDFGLFQIAPPAELATSRDVARTVKDIHGWLGEAILFVAFFHALAALWHHYVRKDDVLTRMLPRRPISN
jgi:cytochrome b561